MLPLLRWWRTFVDRTLCPRRSKIRDLVGAPRLQLGCGHRVDCRFLAIGHPVRARWKRKFSVPSVGRAFYDRAFSNRLTQVIREPPLRNLLTWSGALVFGSLLLTVLVGSALGTASLANKEFQVIAVIAGLASLPLGCIAMVGVRRALERDLEG